MPQAERKFTCHYNPVVVLFKLEASVKRMNFAIFGTQWLFSARTRRLVG